MSVSHLRSVRRILTWGLVSVVVAVGLWGLACGEPELIRSDFTNTSTSTPTPGPDAGNGADVENGTDVDNGEDDDELLSEMDDDQIAEICDDIDSLRQEVGEETVETGNCRSAGLMAADASGPADDPYEMCEDAYQSCLDADDGALLECPMAEIQDGELDGCEATVDELLECFDERFAGGEYLADEASCDEETFDETGSVEDEELMAAGRDMTGLGERCESFFEACPALDPN